MPGLSANNPAAERALGPSLDPWIGQKLDGRYTLEQVLGEGGTGRVYRARQEATGREVAVKLLRDSLIHDDASVRRFQREARAACRINHPNAITVHDFGCSPDGHCYLVTELIEGETLRATLDREGPLSPARAIALFQEIVAGVAAAHDKGVVHRDLHPGNILLCRGDHGEERVKVFDFGGARLVDSSIDTDVTGVGQLDLRLLLHSIRYVSPERLQRGWRPDPRGDVYALGMILFELCTGHHPYDSEDPLQVMAMHLREPPPLLSAWAPERRFSRSLQGLVTSMLAKDPLLRPADATEVAMRLQAAQEREDVLMTIQLMVPEPDIEMEIIALPADEEAEMIPPVLCSIAESQDEAIGAMPTLPDYGDQVAPAPLVAQVRVVPQGPARLPEISERVVVHESWRWPRVLVALFCLLAGAISVFLLGTLTFQWYQRHQHGMLQVPAASDSEPEPAPLRP